MTAMGRWVNVQKTEKIMRILLAAPKSYHRSGRGRTWLEKLIWIGWRKYESLNVVSTDSGNGLSSDRRQSITWNIADLLPIRRLESNKFQWNVNRNSNNLIEETAIQNAVYKIAAMSSRPQCVS